MADLILIAGAALVIGAVGAAVVVARRRSPVALPPVEEHDDVGLLKDRLQLHRELEEDLIAAGQALGRVRRFLIDPDEAGPMVDELRERLTDLWLRRFDYEGRLRMAVLRRRVPEPLSAMDLQEPMNVESAEGLAMQLEELSRRFREVAERGDDSARMLRRLSPAEDAHARWVGDAVEVAQEWRMSQTEEIQRFAGKLNLHADRVDELASQVGDALNDVLQNTDFDRSPDEIVVELPGIRERIGWLSRVGLAESREREIVPGSDAELDAERAIEDARQTMVEVRALARRAGATRSTRTPPEVEAAEAEPESDAPEA